MIKSIDYFSINNLFWIQIKKHLISFGFKGLPADIHFTIGFDERSSDINLHITKNSKDPNNKPKITIVTIDKTLLKQNTNSLLVNLLNKVLQPFDLKKHINEHNYNLSFISFEDLSNSDLTFKTEQGLVDNLKDISEIKRKTRLKIKGDIESRLENFVNSEVFQSAIFEKFVELNDDLSTLEKGGMLISKDNIVQIIYFKDQWYSIRADLEPIDFFSIFVNFELAKRLFYKTKRALVKVKNSNSFEDTRKLSKPIRLISQQQKKDNM